MYVYAKLLTQILQYTVCLLLVHVVCLLKSALHSFDYFNMFNVVEGEKPHSETQCIFLNYYSY